MESLFQKVSNKAKVEFKGQRIQPGWVKYSWNNSIWNLDDGAHPLLRSSVQFAQSCSESDYAIFVWRQKSSVQGQEAWPVLHVRNPDEPLPPTTSYRNPSFFMFMPKTIPPSPPHSGSGGDQRSTKSGKSKKTAKTEPEDTIPAFKKDFERFHNENGVRTIMGDIGPVQNGESLFRPCELHAKDFI